VSDNQNHSDWPFCECIFSLQWKNNFLQPYLLQNNSIEFKVKAEQTRISRTYRPWVGTIRLTKTILNKFWYFSLILPHCRIFVCFKVISGIASKTISVHCYNSPTPLIGSIGLRNWINIHTQFKIPPFQYPPNGGDSEMGDLNIPHFSSK